MRRTCVLLVMLAALTAVASAQTLQPMSSGVVPVVAHLPGKLGSFWTTNMYIRQVEGTMPAQVAITIHNPAGPDWGGTVKLPAAEGMVTGVHRPGIVNHVDGGRGRADIQNTDRFLHAAARHVAGNQ